MISKQKLLKAIESSQKTRTYPKNAQVLLAKSQGEFDFDLEKFKSLIMAIESEKITLEQIAPEIDDDYPHFWTEDTFFVTNLAASSRIHKPNPIIDGTNLKCNGRLFIEGNLKVSKGDLTLNKNDQLIVDGDIIVENGSLSMIENSRLMVTGSLTVSDSWISKSPWNSTAIAGDANIKNAALLFGEVFIGGRFNVPFIHLGIDYAVGNLKVLGGAEAKIIIEDQDDRAAWSEIFGSSSVDFSSMADRNGQRIEKKSKPLDQILLLSKNLDIKEELERKSDIHGILNLILDKIKQKTPILKGDPKDGWIFDIEDEK